MTTRSFAVEGMSCDGCRQTVTELLAAIPGVTKVDVDLKKKRATIEGDESALADDVIINAFASVRFRPVL